VSLIRAFAACAREKNDSAFWKQNDSRNLIRVRERQSTFHHLAQLVLALEQILAIRLAAVARVRHLTPGTAGALSEWSSHAHMA